MKFDVKKSLFLNFPYVFMLWFFDKVGEGYRLAAGADMVTKAMGAVSGLGEIISRNPLPSFHPQDLLVGLIGAAVIRFAVYWKGKNAKKYRHGVEYGSARWRALLPLIDAANIDLKGFTPEWYRRLGGDLDTVKRSVVLAAEQCHVEVTTLLVHGENDSEEEIRSLARWLASVDRNIPLHLSRFFPRYRMLDKPPTPVERVYHLADVAREYLPFVYTGNC